MDFIFNEAMGKPIWMWVGFITLVIALMSFDLGVLNRKQRDMTIKGSLKLSAFYIAIAVAFGGWVWYSLGAQSGKEYLTGLIVEKTLAMDNIFIISLIFSFFAIPHKYQHRVLFWGILGVIVLRGIMIGLGATLISQFGWILYIFAAFLIFTGVKMLFMGEKLPNIEDNPLLKFLRRNMRVTNEFHGNKFTVKLVDANTGKRAIYMTPLLVALIMIEFVDLVFAVDSIPAIFTITTDPYIVYTSNIFAILGLRALYFSLSAIIERFTYLKPALAVVLIFIGSKTFIADALGMEKFPAGISLSVTFGILMMGVIVSLIKTPKETHPPHNH